MEENARGERDASQLGASSKGEPANELMDQLAVHFSSEASDLPVHLWTDSLIDEFMEITQTEKQLETL